MQFLAPVLLALCAQPLGAVEVRAGSRANPIRRVVDLLQKMQKQVTAEGEREADLYDKFKCYCKTGTSDLEKSIEAAEQKIPQVQNSLEAAEQMKSQMDAEIKRAKEDRASAKQTMAKTEALRGKEAAQFSKTSSEYKTNIAAVEKALEALSQGVGGSSFLQSASAAVLRRLAVDVDMSSADRDVIANFLSAGGSSSEGSQYEPQSGQIIGILKQMKETMEKDLADAEAAEEQAIKEYETLVAAKAKEVEALTKAIEAKLESSGELALEIVEYKEDLSDTEETLAADKKFVAELKKGCSTKDAEWEERSKVRNEELLALADTIKLLNDDDALDLFKKTLPGASLLQMMVTGKSMMNAAQSVLQQSPKDPRVALISLALNGGTKSFDKVLKMIDDMVSLLGKEQEADDQKRDYCSKELDQAEDDKKELSTQHDDITKAIDDAKATLETYAKDIAALAEGIKKLDASVKEATKNRQAENAEYKRAMSEDVAAMEVLKMAKNRLVKFYNPKLYKPGDRVPALTQEGAAPSAPPETWEAYKKKGDESAGVLEMMDTLLMDLQKDITESKTAEKDAQDAYEEMMKQSTDKRTADSKSISETEGAKASLEATLQKMVIEEKDTMKELYAKELTIKDLHVECDWLNKNYDIRKSAREGEVDSLKKAQAVLSGADYALVQLESHTARVRRHAA
jgi:chromosome segregation ATPase